MVEARSIPQVFSTVRFRSNALEYWKALSWILMDEGYIKEITKSFESSYGSSSGYLRTKSWKALALGNSFFHFRLDWWLMIGLMCYAKPLQSITNVLVTPSKDLEKEIRVEQGSLDCTIASHLTHIGLTIRRDNSFADQTALMDLPTQNLYAHLTLLRKKEAEVRGVPPYTIFNNITLRVRTFPLWNLTYRLLGNGNVSTNNIRKFRKDNWCWSEKECFTLLLILLIGRKEEFGMVWTKQIVGFCNSDPGLVGKTYPSQEFHSTSKFWAVISSPLHLLGLPH